MIYTTYFANLHNLPKTITPISICGKAPAFYNGLQYKKLAPKYSFFKVWKETRDNDYYIASFHLEVLAKLNPAVVVKELQEKSPTDDFALVCYEKPGNFCHRHLVANWLNNNGYSCEEYTIQ